MVENEAARLCGCFLNIAACTTNKSLTNRRPGSGCSNIHPCYYWPVATGPSPLPRLESGFPTAASASHQRIHMKQLHFDFSLILFSPVDYSQTHANLRIVEFCWSRMVVVSIVVSAPALDHISDKSCPQCRLL